LESTKRRMSRPMKHSGGRKTRERGVLSGRLPIRGGEKASKVRGFAIDEKNERKE